MKKWVMNLTSGLIGALLSYLATLGFAPLKNVVINVDNETLLTLAIFVLLMLYVELRFRSLKNSMETKVRALSQEGNRKGKKSRKKRKS